MAVAPDGRVTAFFGKPDVAQGVDVAIAQIVAEELDVAVDHVSVVLADTARTCDQGGVSGSTGVQLGGIALRNAAAEARRLLVERGAASSALDPAALRVKDGVVSVAADPKKTVSYAELIKAGEPVGRQARLERPMGNGLVAKGKAKPKSPSEYRVVGTSPPRRDIEDKVYGVFAYAADQRLKGHAARPGDPAARRRRQAAGGGRGEPGRHSRRAGGAQGRLHRRGGREGMGRGQGRPRR